MSTRITSKDFEWVWRNRTRCIMQVYKLIMIGCTHESVLHFIAPKDEFLKCGHALRGKMITYGEYSGEEVEKFNRADCALEAVWEEVIPLIKLVN